MKYHVGTFAHGPGRLRISVETNAEGEINAAAEYPIKIPRRKMSDELLNDLERLSYDSTNSSIGWIGTFASLFCSIYSSYLHKTAPEINCLI